MRRKKILLLLLMTLLLLLSLAGCSKEEEPPTLWVVTEESAWDGMNFQAEQMIEKFKTIHPEFTVNLDILPQEKAARELYFKQLRTMIAGGKGPDVYLMPTDTTYHGDDWRTDRVKRKLRELEPLFLDTEQALRNGLFTDVGPYYDADIELKTEELNPAIMSAGCFRNGRYILPLRYDFPVLFVDKAKLKDYGLTIEDVDGGITEVLDTAIAVGDENLACAAEPFWLRTEHGFSLLKHPLDYAQTKVTVTAEEVADLLRKIQKVAAMAGDNNDHRRPMVFNNFFMMYYCQFEDGGIPDYDDDGIFSGYISNYPETKKFPSRLPMRVGTMHEAAKVKAVSMVRGDDYAMIPLRDSGGDLTAYVTYWGAVGAGCDHPKEAYDFLRLFLTADAQFERNRPVSADPMANFYGAKPGWTELMEEGWPVRTRGSAEAIWSVYKTGASDIRPNRAYRDTKKYKVPAHVKDLPLSARGVVMLRMTDDDLTPMLEAEFDHISYGCYMEQEFARMVRSLNDLDTGAPTDVDIDKMAEDFVHNLLYHVCEG